MFADDRANPSSSSLDGSDRDMTSEERLQYTLKGVEKRSLDLMRDAARADGMKIGAWVSRHMREAAEASLAVKSHAKELRSEWRQDGLPSNASARDGQNNVEEIVRELSRLFEIQFQSIHSDLERIKEVQSVILSGLIAGGVRRSD
jgi:hypothetical protein